MKAVLQSLAAIGAIFMLCTPASRAIANDMANTDEINAVSELAAMIAAANSLDEINALIFNAQSNGLSDEDIAFALGLAKQLMPNNEFIASAFLSLQVASGENAEKVSQAYAAGLDSLTRHNDKPSDAAASGGETIFNPEVLGSSGIQNSGGGGGASPK